MRPGAGLPPSIWNVPPFLSIMPKLLLPPKVWFHGNQSTSTCGRSSRKGQTTAYCSWVTVSMRCVLITPLGVPVEPEVKRVFATVPGPMPAKASSTSELAFSGSSSSIDVGLAPTAASAGANFVGSAVHTKPARTNSQRLVSLAKSLDISDSVGQPGGAD